MPKGGVRFAKSFEAFDRMNVQFFHPECLIRVLMPNARSWGFTNIDEVKGADTLSKEDRDWLQSMLDEVASRTVPESWVVRGAPDGAPAATGKAAPKKKAPAKKKKAKDEDDDDDDDDDDDEDEEEYKPKAKRARKAPAKAAAAAAEDEGEGEGGDLDGYGGGAFAAEKPTAKPKAKAAAAKKAAKDDDEGDDDDDGAAAGGAGKPAKAPKAAKGKVEASMLTGGAMPIAAGGVYVVTGFRDKEAMEALEGRGCKMSGSFSKKTTAVVCKAAGAAITDKVLEAQRNGTPVYTHAQLRAALGLGEAE